VGGLEIGGLADVVRSPIYATGVGLAVYGAHRRMAGGMVEATDGSLGHRLRDWLNRLF
jgi:cell division protein FtsA